MYISTFIQILYSGHTINFFPQLPCFGNSHHFTANCSANANLFLIGTAMEISSRKLIFVSQVPFFIVPGTTGHPADCT